MGYIEHRSCVVHCWSWPRADSSRLSKLKLQPFWIWVESLVCLLVELIDLAIHKTSSWLFLSRSDTLCITSCYLFDRIWCICRSLIITERLRFFLQNEAWFSDLSCSIWCPWGSLLLIVTVKEIFKWTLIVSTIAKISRSAGLDKVRSILTEIVLLKGAFLSWRRFRFCCCFSNSIYRATF